MPRKFSTPVGPPSLLNSIRSDIWPKEKEHRKMQFTSWEYICPQRAHKTAKKVIKLAHKGAGIVILNFPDYMKACYNYLLSSLPNKSDNKEPELYYKAVNEFSLEGAKT